MYGELVQLRDWLLLLVLTGILAVSIAVYLPTNPSVFYSIIVGLLIGILFLVVLALRPEYKQSLIEGLSRLRKKDMETGGRFNRYGRLAGFLIVINFLGLSFNGAIQPCLSPVLFIIHLHPNGPWSDPHRQLSGNCWKTFTISINRINNSRISSSSYCNRTISS
jgi:hypothetical protein